MQSIQLYSCRKNRFYGIWSSERPPASVGVKLFREVNPKKCIPPEKICDGRKDCILRDDEADCPVSCQDGFHCKKSNRCIDPTQQCDGVLDCVYGEDEQGAVVQVNKN